MSFYLFRRYFFSSRSGSLIKLVSWVCLAGMTVSVAALILIVSIMGGFGQAIQSRLLDKEAHLVIHFKDNPFLKKALIKTKKESLFFNKEEPPVIFTHLTRKQKKGIQSATIFETQDLILKSSKSFKGVSAIGYSKNQWNKKVEQMLSWEESNLIPLDQNRLNQPIAQNPKLHSIPLKQNQEKEILLSEELALEMGLVSGDELTLIPLAGLLLPPNLMPPVKRFKVKGILPTASTGKESLFIYYKQGLMNFGDFSKIKYRAEIKLYDPEKAPLYKNLFKNHEIQSWIERNSTLFFALKLEKFIMTLFLVLAFVISCLGVSSALFLLITQKGEDLAILHAMGLSQKELIKIFTKVGLSLTLISLLAGIFIGLAGTVFLKYNSINLLPEMYQDRTIPAVFMPANYLMILLGAWLLTWISCYLPTKYLSRINPSELLKTTGL